MKLIMDTNALITVCKFSVEGDLLIKLILEVCYITIPSTVKEEAIAAKDIYSDAKVASDFIESGRIEVAQATIPELTFLKDYNLGKGEKGAIRLCLERKSKINYLITDDWLTYIVCDRMRIPKLFFLGLVIELAKQGEIDPKFAEKIIKVASSRYSRGMVTHSFAILKEVLGNGRSKSKEA